MNDTFIDAFANELEKLSYTTSKHSVQVPTSSYDYDSGEYRTEMVNDGNEHNYRELDPGDAATLALVSVEKAKRANVAGSRALKSLGVAILSAAPLLAKKVRAHRNISMALGAGAGAGTIAGLGFGAYGGHMRESGNVDSEVSRKIKAYPTASRVKVHSRAGDAISSKAYNGLDRLG
jgi:hypothetical protein